MLVKTEELKALHKYVLKSIETIKASDDSNSEYLFDLNTIDSNLSLLLDLHDSEKEIELTPRDKQIKDALKKYKTERGKEDAKVFIKDLTSSVKDIIEKISKLDEKTKDTPHGELYSNIHQRLEAAENALYEIIRLENDSRALKEWQSKAVNMHLSGAGAALGRAKSERKAIAARENGKKGGRPRKEASKKTSQAKKSPKKVAKAKGK